MDKKPLWKAKLIYKLDCLFSKGISAMILFLGIASISIIVLASVIAVSFHIAPQNSESLSFFEAFWASATLDRPCAGPRQFDRGAYRL